jgi:monofunctional biosynthetic peptidoglycan transglycosylase
MKSQKKPRSAPRSRTGAKPRVFRIALTVVLAVVVALPLAGVLAHRFLPPPITILALQRLAEGRGYQRHWRSLDRISPNLVYAAIAAEDANFCRHDGFDFAAIRKAVKHNGKHGAHVRGASTITQQTAKNVFLWPGRGWIRKGAEAWYTVLIETIWGKRRTMEVYLNVVEWGPGVYGAQAASRYWFKTDADRLTAGQAARLAAILPDPLEWKAAKSGPYVRARTGRISAAMGTVRAQGLAACVLK